MGKNLGPATIFLLQADEWNFDLEQDCSLTTFVPLLAPLLDALIHSLQDSLGGDIIYRLYLGCMVSYLHGNVLILRDHDDDVL